MFSLRMAVYLLVAPTVAGAFVIALLTANMVTASYIAGAAIAGAVVSIPIAWVLANRLHNLIEPKNG